MKNKFGILLPISSLPGKYGIGDFGKSSFDFVDFLKSKKYKYWQILPINPVGPGNSPYMSSCSEAIDPRYIDLDELLKKEFIKEIPNVSATNNVNYYDSWIFKKKYLKEAFSKFIQKIPSAYKKFKAHNSWVYPYSFFTYLKDDLKMGVWNSWPDDFLHYYDDGILEKLPNQFKPHCEFYIFCQFIAFQQFSKLKKYVNKNGIKLIADCPFYVGLDSVDCWINKEQFVMDDKYNPTIVGGCPPDAFSENGQLWGNPIYNFEKMKDDNYSFLVKRIGKLSSYCDYLRLDHFRAFDTYCVIPANDENAKRGKWINGPGIGFFECLYRKYPKINLIAEDLGEQFDSVHLLRDSLDLPGMYITQFYIFDDLSKFNHNIIVYPGTHDNETVVGWINSINENTRNILYDKLKTNDLYKGLMEFTANIPSKITIFSMQDLLGLDNGTRLNLPGTVGSPNWEWKLADNSYKENMKFNPNYLKNKV